MSKMALPSSFLELSARLGQNPLLVQGPGGNTSLKQDTILWIKASGTLLADATRLPVFVAVDQNLALAEANGAGDGTCKAAVLDPALALRPSIETTFHALISHRVVVHVHSVATLVHAISPEGSAALKEKLQGLPFQIIPYCKPGRPLTHHIAHTLDTTTRVWILQNHGLICAGENVNEVEALLQEVETRLAMPVLRSPHRPLSVPPVGYEWHENASGILRSQRLANIAHRYSLYPDHVVFLGPGLAAPGLNQECPAAFVEGEGIAIKSSATSAQRAMLQCLADILLRLPEPWNVSALTRDQEVELLNWDAEKYRQALAAQAGQK